MKQQSKGFTIRTSKNGKFAGYSEGKKIFDQDGFYDTLPKQNKSWEKRFRDFYWEIGEYAGRKLGIDEYIKFIQAEISAAGERGKQEIERLKKQGIKLYGEGFEKGQHSIAYCPTCNCVTKKVCAKCYGEVMGVSKWKEIGKKYGYWDYFEKQRVLKGERRRIIEQIRQAERERIIKEIKDYRDKFFPILTPDYVVITEMLKYPPFQP